MSVNIKLSLSEKSLSEYLAKQVGVFFPDNDSSVLDEISSILPEALQRLEYCFSFIRRKYYVDDHGIPMFNHLNTDQYCMFLYFVANTAWRKNPAGTLAAKLYALNKCLHSIDLFYSVQLPDIFLFSHPVGTVLGRAEYSNYLVVYQNVTVGSNLAGEYPELGEGVALYCNAKLIGNCKVGKNVSLAAGSLVIDSDIAENHIVYGMYPDVKLKAAKHNCKGYFFSVK